MVWGKGVFIHKEEAPRSSGSRARNFAKFAKLFLLREPLVVARAECTGQREAKNAMTRRKRTGGLAKAGFPRWSVESSMNVQLGKNKLTFSRKRRTGFGGRGCGGTGVVVRCAAPSRRDRQTRATPSASRRRPTRHGRSPRRIAAVHDQ